MSNILQIWVRLPGKLISDLLKRQRLIVRVAMAAMSLTATAVLASDTLNWRADQNRVSADIKAGELYSLLGQIASASGWQIYVEPDLTHRVSAKFQNLPPGEALHHLLGDVNFALVPRTNANPRLYVFRTSMQKATQFVPPSKPADKTAKVIPNELIVRLKPGAKIDELARALGAKVIGRIDGLNAYRLQFDNQTAADTARVALTQNPDVASVESNYSIDRPENPQVVEANPPGLRMQLNPPPANGRVTIGLLDTAVQPLGNDLDQFLLKQLSVAGQAQLDPNSPTHGTAMAETMLRTLQTLGNGSSSIQILPVDVYGPNESTSTFDVALGIKAAVDAGANPISMSLGSPSDSQLLRDLINQGSSKGITFYAAKGNSPDTSPQYPAGDKGVTAVTALDNNGQVASWANRAPIPAVGALGSVLVPYDGQAYMVQGTSPATAIVSATASRFMEKGPMSAVDANAQILKASTPTTIPGK
jgi:thermitase